MTQIQRPVSPEGATTANTALDTTDWQRRDYASRLHLTIVGILMFSTYAVFGMTWAACGSLLTVIMGDLSLSLSQASFLTTSVGLAKIVGPTIAGVLAARMDLRRTFMLASALICVGIVAPLSSNYTALLLARFGMGLGGAMALVYFSPIAMKWFPERGRIIVNGANAVSGNAGMMVALFITPHVMASLGGSWRKTLGLYSACSMLVAALWLFFGKATSGTKSILISNRRGFVAGYRAAMKDPNTWKLSFACAGATTVSLVLFTYFPTYYSKTLGFSKDTMVFYAPAIAMCAGIPGTLLGIYLSNRIGKRIPFIRYPGLVYLLAAIGMIVFRSPALIVTSSIALGFSLFLAIPSLLTMPQELPGQTSENVGYVMGIFWSSSYAVATIVVWLMGRIIDASGSFQLGLAFTAVPAATLLISSFSLPETGRLREREPKGFSN